MQGGDAKCRGVAQNVARGLRPRQADEEHEGIGRRRRVSPDEGEGERIGGDGDERALSSRAVDQAAGEFIAGLSAQDLEQVLRTNIGPGERARDFIGLEEEKIQDGKSGDGAACDPGNPYRFHKFYAMPGVQLECGRIDSYTPAIVNQTKRNAVGKICKAPDQAWRVVVIEDQRLFAEFLSLHCRELGLDVRAQCGSGAAGLAAVRAERPDLVLLDIALPDADGLEIARVVLGEFAQIKILAISSHRDAWTMLQVQRIGLHGFLDKQDQQPAILTEAIQAVMAGQIFYSPIVREASARLRCDPLAFNRVLSDYEIRILSLIGESQTDEEIATTLNVSAATVQSRRRDIMRKIDVHSTPKLIHYAIMHGLTRPDALGKPATTPGSSPQLSRATPR